MKPVRVLCQLLPIGLLAFLLSACTTSSPPPDPKDTLTTIEDPVYGEDTAKWMPDTTRFMFVDTTGIGHVFNEYEKVKNLLQFHTRDTMTVDSTYLATLAMGKDISIMELAKKTEDIVEPGGRIKLVDTTEELSMHMEANLQDKAPETDKNFIIEPVGGKSNRRTYDAKKNKMIWQWKVTPKKQGLHELILSISHVSQEGFELGSPETKRHAITIFSAKKKKGSVGRGIGSFFEKYWQWLIGAIALPIFIAWFTSRRKKPPPEPEITSKPSANWKKKRRRY